MRTLLIILAVSFASFAKAQEANDIEHIEKSTTFAIGQTNRLDTYLSPEKYKGTDFHFISDIYRVRPDRLNLNFTHEGAIDYTHNRADNANSLAGHYNFAFSMLKAIKHRSDYGIHAGFMSDLYTGFAYNMRNTANNPAQGYASLSIGGAIKAYYNISIGNKYLKVNYEARLPLVGLSTTETTTITL